MITRFCLPLLTLSGVPGAHSCHFDWLSIQENWDRAARHSQFLAGPGSDFRIQTIICLFLNNRDFFVLSSTCIVTYLDKSEVSLSATAIRLHVSRQLDSYEVPTPPLAD